MSFSMFSSALLDSCLSFNTLARALIDNKASSSLVRPVAASQVSFLFLQAYAEMNDGWSDQLVTYICKASQNHFHDAEVRVNLACGLVIKQTLQAQLRTHILKIFPNGIDKITDFADLF